MDAELNARLDRLESLLESLVERGAVKAHYSVEEFARLIGREPFTVREYARLGRVRASKKASGRGKHANWVFSHEELERFRRDGLLPDRRAHANTKATA